MLCLYVLPTLLLNKKEEEKVHLLTGVFDGGKNLNFKS